MQDDVLLTRAEAAQYLQKKYGKLGKITTERLAWLACRGGGPVYYRLGNKTGYWPPDLDAWQRERCSLPLLRACEYRSDEEAFVDGGGI